LELPPQYFKSHFEGTLTITKSRITNTNFLQTMVASNSLMVQQCCPSMSEDKHIEDVSLVEMDFDIVPYPISSPTEGERQERANLTKRFGDAWSTPPSNHFRPIDAVVSYSTMSCDMDSDDDLSIASNEEVISTDIFSQTTAMLQQTTNTDVYGISFINVVAWSEEDLSDQDSKKENKAQENKEAPSQEGGDDFHNCSPISSVFEW
jgi:hypothetical protein